MAKKTTFTLKNSYPLVVQLLLLFYIVVATPPPPAIAILLHSYLGHVGVVVAALGVFAVAGEITGILALAAAYVLLERSALVTGPIELHQDIASQQPPAGSGHTLEEQIVADMAPAEDASSSGPASYLPVLTALHGVGSPIHVDE